MEQLEQQRSSLEELHTIEDAITQRIRRNPELVGLPTRKKRPYKETLLQQHEMQRFKQLYKERMATANDKEIPVMSLDEFDAHLQVIKEEGTNAMARPMAEPYALKSSRVNLLSEIGMDLSLRGMFSGEEFHGKCLDLVQFHEQWLQFSENKISYIQYLQIFDKFEQQELNKGKEYLEYLISLVDYLKRFISRTEPLFDLESFVISITREYTEDQDGLYCRACEKTFAKQTVYDGHLSGKKHLKNQQRLDSSNGGPKGDGQSAMVSKDFKFYEHEVFKLTEHLYHVREQTKDNTVRRMGLSERERMMEIDQLAREEELSSESESEHEAETTTMGNGNNLNPHNLPLGADGHPIPFWLFKLYGLKIEYPCEICDFKYKGRKAYDKHFTDVRHSQRLRILGIEPSEVFKDISSVEEAKRLWEDLKKQKRTVDGERENAVEVEDEEGNVMSEKVYNDLKKQGLI